MRKEAEARLEAKSKYMASVTILGKPRQEFQRQGTEYRTESTDVWKVE